MESGLLSLKWNNHSSTFFHVLETIRKKELYSDVTIACDGKFFSVHKLVLSTCSEYFQEMFERTQCKHPIIVLKDINSQDLESLLNYMYIGEVNVLQTELSSLIKAAECLKVKGLAVPDEPPPSLHRKGNKRPGVVSDKDEGSVSKRNRRQGPPPISSLLPSEALSPSTDSRLRNDLPPTSPSSDSTRQQESSDKERRLGSDVEQSSSHSFKEFESPVMVKSEKEDPPPDDFPPGELPPVNKFDYEDSPGESSAPQGIDDNSESTYRGQLPPPPQQSADDSMGHLMPSTSRYGESSNWPSNMDRGEESTDKEGGDGANYDPNAFILDNISPQAKGPMNDGAEMVQCPDCPAQLSVTAYNSHLRLHLTQHLHCDSCGYRTVRRDRLEAHLKTHENPDSSFTCPHCPFTSRHRTSLCRHLKSHLVRVPFSCPHCHYNTSDSSNYKRHLRIRHRTTPREFSKRPY